LDNLVDEVGRRVMKNKKKQIVTIAKELFSEQGIKNTTIAQIAQAAGIAKGSVYSSFDSKNDIIEAIFIDEFDKAQSDIKECLSSNLAGEALLENYILTILQQVLSDKSFQKVLLAEIDASLSPGIFGLLQSYRIESRQLLIELLTKIFGSEIKVWEQDLVCVLDGIILEYSTYLTVDDVDIDIVNCAKFISRTLINVVEGILKEKSDLHPVLNFEQSQDADPLESIADIVKRMKDNGNNLEDIKRDEFYSALEVLESTAAEYIKELNTQTKARQKVMLSALIEYLPKDILWQTDLTKLKIQLDL
jgi:AcrR family transcriptional regulator